MIQGGDPNGDGTGGPGYAIRGEFSSNGVENDLSHVRGVLSMARSSANDSAGSQFFIMHADSDYLDGNYAAFGMVLGGLDTVDVIASVPTDSNDKPRTEQVMRTVYVETYGKTYTFTKLEAELKAELEARRRQYHYYRDQLPNFEGRDDVQWMTLGGMSLDFGRGKSKHRPRNDQKLYGGNIPFIQTGDIRNASHTITEYTQTYSDFGLQQSKLWPKGTLCITIAANIAETTILSFDACFPDSVIGFVADPGKTSSSYVEYLLSSFKKNLQSQSTGSAQDNINMGTFESTRLPFPPLEEQTRIVAILDKFDALVNDLSSGLPAEIAARRKQYEYYRDRLLTFKEAQ